MEISTQCPDYYTSVRLKSWKMGGGLDIDADGAVNGSRTLPLKCLPGSGGPGKFKEEA